ncbi:M28 family peptidase [Parasphingopyxis marina]|uniref:M28 family peptidase n=1 Tax=Parasphingopyxis marina TaxID=2761622 RepID=A0A842HZU6_9SPHN|nr:M28 family peptidase [Parasphingopyxis marina]MBC2777899.1 M28 family peptidase [Parasphingopyxis marina]
MIVRLLAAAAALLLAAPLPAQALPTEGELRAHIETLASDAFQGRQPGTQGEAMATQYIAQQMAQAGLQPGYGGNFFQPVALVERREGQARIRIGGADPAAPETAQLLLLGNMENVELAGAPVLFAGYGLDTGRDGEDSFADARFDGAVVLFLAGWPEGMDDGPSYRSRIASFRERGAQAAIGIIDPDLPWQAARAGMMFRQTYLASHVVAPVEGIMSAAMADALFAGIGRNYAGLEAMAAQEDFAPSILDVDMVINVTTPIDRFDGFNIVGRLPGSGNTGEAVLFTAHHDHFGICRPEGREDRICNGAVDNASGTAAVIEVARTIAAGPRPVRDILFVTTTAEELGLLGAIEFADHPPMPLDDIVAVFNLDTIAIAPRGAPVGIIGRGMTPLDDLIDTVAREAGRDIYTGLDVNAFVNRHDGWVFFERGVPAVMVGGSFTDPELRTGFLSGPYHAPEDEAEGLELGGAIEDVWLHIALGRAFADPARYRTPQR